MLAGIKYIILVPFSNLVLSCVLTYFYGINCGVVGSFLLFYFLVYWIGGNVYHRYWAHKSFELTKPVEIATSILGLFVQAGDPLSYSQTHRWHHAHSDTELDIHSPSHGYFHAFIGWTLNQKELSPFIIRDLLRPEFKYLQTLAKHKVKIIWLTLLILYLVSPTLAHGLSIAMSAAFLSELLINVIAHDAEKKCAINSRLAAVLSLGPYHGRHHENPRNTTGPDLGRWLMNIIRKNDVSVTRE